MGAAEMHVKDPGGAIPEREARSIAARSMGIPVDALRLFAETSGLRIYQPTGDDFSAVRAVDWEGGLRVQRSRALVRTTKPSTANDMLALVWRQTARAAVPGLFLIFERHVVDLSGVENSRSSPGTGRERACSPTGRNTYRPHRRSTWVSESPRLHHHQHHDADHQHRRHLVDDAEELRRRASSCRR